MAAFDSTEALLEEVATLIAQLEAAGHDDAASELREGRQCLNGLTDGWAAFLDAIRRIERDHAAAMPAPERRTLRAIRDAVRAAVHRR